MIATAETAEHWSNVAANVATTLALLVGGWWTYSRFIKQRTGNVRAALNQSINHRHLTDEDLLVRVIVTVENTGSVLLPLEHLRCEIYQVAPAPPETLKKLKRRELISEDDYEADLPCIRGYEQDWKKGTVEIEPGESDIFSYDFVVSAEVATILVYAYVPNTEKKKSGIGWEVSALYDINLTPRP